MTYDSTQDTLKHIRRVQELLNTASSNLVERGRIHDISKLESPEKEIFDIMTPKLKGLIYGSAKYKESLKELGVALEHHYTNNSHHPQFHNNGVDDMSLFDILEMLLDWKAATERHYDGDIMKSIDINEKRFEINPQLSQILRNTIKEMNL